MSSTYCLHFNNKNVQIYSNICDTFMQIVVVSADDVVRAFASDGSTKGCMAFGSSPRRAITLSSKGRVLAGSLG